MHHAERGGAVLELAFVTPVAVLVLTGAIALVRSVAIVFPLEQATYQVAIRGSEFTVIESHDRLPGVAREIVESHRSTLADLNANNVALTSHYDSAENSVDISLSTASIDDNTTSLPGTSIRRSVNAPLLARAVTLSVAGGFAQDPKCAGFYSCDLSTCEPTPSVCSGAAP